MIQKNIHKSPKEQVQIPINSIAEFIIWKLNALLVCDTNPISFFILHT